MPKIIFVCTANRYRSPIAQACFRRELSLHNRADQWQVLSAGTWAVDGMPAASEAIHQASRLGLDISGHRSQIITPELVRTADLIIVMERGHQEALQIEFPDSAYKVRLLSEAATGNSYNVPDPAVSGSDDGVPEEISGLIHNGFDRICILASTQHIEG